MSETPEPVTIFDPDRVAPVGRPMVAALRADKALALADIRAASACVAVLLLEGGTRAFEKAAPADVVGAARKLQADQPLTWAALTAKSHKAKLGQKPAASVNLHRVAHSIAAHKPAEHGAKPTTAQPEDLAAIIAALRN